MRSRALQLLLVMLGWTPMVAMAVSTANTSPSGAVSYEVGQGWVTTAFDDTTNAGRYWSYADVGGRSYCVEAVQGSVSPISLDPSIAVYTDAAATVPLVYNAANVANNNGGGDPVFLEGSRACYIASGGTNTRTLKVSVALGAGDTGYIKFRVVETTLFAPYWDSTSNSSGSGQPLASNNTRFFLANRTVGTTINATLNFYMGQTGTTSPVSKTITAGTGSGYSSNVTPSYSGAAASSGVSGHAYIAHDGPPGALEVFVIPMNNTTNNTASYRALPRQ